MVNMRKYPTQNLYEASYLLSSGFKFISKDSNGHKTTLFFENSPELIQAVSAFYNGDARVSVRAFVENYRHLKDMVFQR